MTKIEFVDLVGEFASKIASVSMNAILEALAQGGIRGLPDAAKIMADGVCKIDAHTKIVAEYDAITSENSRLREALTKIMLTAKSWEGRKEAPYWNLGDIASSALGTKED